MEKTLQGLCNFCNGRDSDDYVEVMVRHPIGPFKSRVRLFPSLAEPVGIFVGYNKRQDGAVIRANVGDVRSAARSLQAGLTETVEFV